MPRGKEHKPKINMEMKLTAISLSVRGRKVNIFANLPMINGKAVISAEKLDEMAENIGAERGDTISHG